MKGKLISLQLRHLRKRFSYFRFVDTTVTPKAVTLEAKAHFWATPREDLW